MSSRFRNMPQRVLVAPSILSADFARMREECESILRPAGGRAADMLHLDVMDGHFAPNLTMGPDMCRALRRAFPDVCLDVHLMVEHPDRFVEPFARAGADVLTFHAEVVPVDAARELAARIRELGCSPSLAINPATPAEAAEPLLDALDMVLVMSVVPGFSGQAFMPEVLGKVRRLRSLAPGLRIEMDGGVALTTAPECRAAGADVLVAATAIFGETPHKRGEVVAELRG